jgi:hypothetical protein
MEERGLGVVVNMKDFEVCLTRLLEIEGDADRRNSLSQC